MQKKKKKKKKKTGTSEYLHLDTTDVDPRRVVTRFMLWISRMIFNSDGLSYENHTKTMWTYHRVMVLESISSRQRESAFTITAGVKKKPNTSLFIYRGKIRLKQEQNPHIFIHSRLM